MSQTQVHNSTQLTSDYYTIIPHPTQPQVLMLTSEHGWTLPHFQLTEYHLWQEVNHVNQIIRKLLAIQVTTLRCVCAEYDSQAKRVLLVYAMDNQDADWIPPDGGQWVGCDELDSLPLSVPEHYSILENWFTWSQQTPTSPLRVPWYQPGWFKCTNEWIDEELKRHGLSVTSAVEQIRSWQRSSILRTNTSAGDVYFKAVWEPFAHEPGVTRVLAQHWPQHFPTVISINAEQHWFLTLDMGGKPLSQASDIRVWQRAMQTFAQLQLELAHRTNCLLSLECPQRHLDNLVVHLNPLLADTAAMLPGQPQGLSESQIEALRSLTSQVGAKASQLASYNLPNSLVHGDLWSSNIIVTDQRFIYFDWSDCSISHPFFDLVFFLMNIEEELPEVPQVRSRLRDAYLEPWTVYEPMERLIVAFELSQPLAWLHKALIDYQIILQSEAATKHEFENTLPFYLAKLLDQSSLA